MGSVGSITNSQRMFGVRAQSLGCPFRLRVENEHGEEKLFTLNGIPRAVFTLKSEKLQNVFARTVKRIDGGTDQATVLWGDGKAIDGTLCDCFRMRFRTNVLENDFYFGFVFSEADAMDWNEQLGYRANKEHSVGIIVNSWGFF